MDINAALERMRQLQRTITALTDLDSDSLSESEIQDLRYNADALVIVTEAIDGWLTKGGFKPSDWS